MIPKLFYFPLKWMLLHMMKWICNDSLTSLRFKWGGVSKKVLRADFSECRNDGMSMSSTKCCFPTMMIFFKWIDGIPTIVVGSGKLLPCNLGKGNISLSRTIRQHIVVGTWKRTWRGGTSPNFGGPYICCAIPVSTRFGISQHPT